MKPIDPSPTPWDHSTWGFYCDTCDCFFDLLTDGKVTLPEMGICVRWHKCGAEARYIGYARTVKTEYCHGCKWGSHCLGADPDCACCL